MFPFLNINELSLTFSLRLVSLNLNVCHFSHWIPTWGVLTLTRGRQSFTGGRKAPLLCIHNAKQNNSQASGRRTHWICQKRSLLTVYDCLKKHDTYKKFFNPLQSEQIGLISFIDTGRSQWAMKEVMTPQKLERNY